MQQYRTNKTSALHLPAPSNETVEDQNSESNERQSSPVSTNDESSEGAVPDLLGQIGDLSGSRRTFLSNVMKTGVGAAALGTAGAGTAAAAHEDEPYSDSDYEDQNEFGYGALSDREIIRFALLLERLEATFYTEAVGTAEVNFDEKGQNKHQEGGRLSEREIENSDSARQFAAEPDLRFSTFEYFQIIRDHEQTHVTALEDVLAAIDGNPDFASDVEFTFPYNCADQFVDLAQILEDTGAGAYTAAAPAIDTEKYLASAAQILAVEARHASYLRVLTTASQLPFPEAFQEKLSVTTVAERVVPLVNGVDDASQVVELVKVD